MTAYAQPVPISCDHPIVGYKIRLPWDDLPDLVSLLNEFRIPYRFRSSRRSGPTRGLS